MIHAVVPALGERNELRVVIKSFVSAELGRVAVQHYLVTWTVLSLCDWLTVFHIVTEQAWLLQR